MDYIEVVFLAVLQGITEWFPISSSGHLAFSQGILGIQGDFTFDVFLHFGTLLAVLFYFRKDILDIVRDIVNWNRKSENFKIGLYVLIASIPGAIIGLLFSNFVSGLFGSVLFVSVCFMITGIILCITSYSNIDRNNLTMKESFFVGLAQAFALLPGISRSGSTISAGMLLGLRDKEAIRFSFLLSIPITLGANIIAFRDFLNLQSYSIDIHSILLGIFVSFVVGIFAIHLLYGKMMASKKNLKWFGFYCLIIGIAGIIYSLIN